MAAADLRNVRTVFLDRDGTINVKAAEGDYIRSPAELELLPGAATALAALNAAGLRTVLVTNQRWLSNPPPTQHISLPSRTACNNCSRTKVPGSMPPTTVRTRRTVATAANPAPACC